MTEQWKPVTQELFAACTRSYLSATRGKDLYEGSDQGRIRNRKTGKVLKVIKDHCNTYHPKGRPARVRLAVAMVSGSLEFQVSHLVYGAFHPEALKLNRLYNSVIGHKDGDKWNNRLENLELRCTRAC